MKIKIFDESHEKDLEAAINNFLKEKEAEIIGLSLLPLVFLAIQHPFFYKWSHKVFVFTIANTFYCL